MVTPQLWAALYHLNFGKKTLVVPCVFETSLQKTSAFYHQLLSCQTLGLAGVGTHHSSILHFKCLGLRDVLPPAPTQLVTPCLQTKTHVCPDLLFTHPHQLLETWAVSSPSFHKSIHGLVLFLTSHDTHFFLKVLKKYLMCVMFFNWMLYPGLYEYILE